MRKKSFFVQVFLLLSFLFLLPKGLEAAYFKLEPATVSTNANETFTISVNIDTEEEEVNSADVYITFDADLLEVNQVAEGSFFPTVTHNISNGQVYVAGLVEDPASSKKGTGTIATITFKALKDGTATLSIDCSSSKIVKADINATNILDCSKNSPSQVTIGTGNQTQTNQTQTNQTQTSSSQTSSTSSTSSPTPASLPRSGVFENFLKIGLPGIIFFSLGIIGKILLRYRQ